jgi:glycerol-3-phosphate acyltransferase PlsX
MTAFEAASSDPPAERGNSSPARHVSVALDAMGGDFAPRVTVAGAVRAVRSLPVSVLLVGDESRLVPELSGQRYDPSRIRIVHTAESVAMEDPATVVLRDKPRASVRVACELVARGEADAAVSAGHSGAMMVAAKSALGAVPGVDRPAIATALPLKHGSVVLVDSGANVDCRPHFLLQFAQMGSLYARHVLGVARPRVALLSNGAEAGKGNELVRAAYPLLEQGGFDFAGNLEARDLFRGRADVVVCDGFVGNVVLKTAEGIGQQLRLLTRDTLGRSPLGWLGYLLMRRLFAELARRTDYHEVGGSPLLGLNRVAVVCHGSSQARTVESAIGIARRCVETGLSAAIAAELRSGGDADRAAQHDAR